MLAGDLLLPGKLAFQAGRSLYTKVHQEVGQSAQTERHLIDYLGDLPLGHQVKTMTRIS